LINLATAHIALNQHTEAIPHLEQAARIAPKNSRPHLLLASVYHHLNRKSEKEQHLQKAKMLAEDNPDPEIINGIEILSNPIPAKKDQ
jgi:Flp pilus assembly protein TadD